MENLNNTDKTSENAEKELRISDVIYSRWLEKIEREEREIRNMLYMWQEATQGKDVILCVGNDCI